MKEEQLWQQWSKSHWISQGDRNTTFFSRISQRFRWNCIHCLQNQVGELCCGDDNVVALLVDYYKSQCTIAYPSDIDVVLQFVPQVVTNEMNALLTHDFTREEVKIALKHMTPLKAPSLDGLPPIFFQHYWQSIGDDVSKAFLSCLNTGCISLGIIHTYITLIPKVKSPQHVT